MSELIVKIGSNGPSPLQYQDGDIVSSYNQRRIDLGHVSGICSPRKSTLNADGLHGLKSLFGRCRQITSKTILKRVSPTEVSRKSLLTGIIDILSDVPNQKDEHIHVQEYIDYWIAQSEHGLFGKKGSEAWFGDVWHRSNSAKMIEVWGMIEANSIKRRADHTRLNLSDGFLKDFLVVSVNDTSDFESQEMQSPEFDVDDNMTKKRKNYLDLNTLNIGVPLSQIRDRSKKVDTRRLKTHQNADIVKVRT